MEINALREEVAIAKEKRTVEIQAKDDIIQNLKGNIFWCSF